MNYILTEPDIRIFLREAPRTSRIWHTAKYALAVVAAATLACGVLASVLPRQIVAEQSPVSVPLNAVATATPAPSTAPTATPLPVTLPNDTISLGDLKISAPITWEVAMTTKEMNAALEKGVIHLAGTPLPGEQGMASIAGHSSNYPWAKGDFNGIFAPLTKAQTGQLIELNYAGVMYQYKISKIYEVKPNNVDILTDNSRTGLRLITCTPVGTSLRRLVVEADQIFPDPSKAVPFTGQAPTGSLPSDR